MLEPKIPKINYGNWVSRKFIFLPVLISLIFFCLSFISPLLLTGALFFLIPAVYFSYTYYEFAPKGGNVQAKIRSLLFEHLDWDGEGRVLDIGCGNGALAVEFARKYPHAEVTGIDYWGKQWEYSQKAREENALNTEVAERTVFQKASAAALPFGDASFQVAVSNLVFHEVADARDKREVIKEALRVVKNGGAFVFQDLFLVKRLYGEPRTLLATIKGWGIREVSFINTSDQEFIPTALKLPFMVGLIGIIYGRK